MYALEQATARARSCPRQHGFAETLTLRTLALTPVSYLNGRLVAFICQHQYGASYVKVRGNARPFRGKPRLPHGLNRTDHNVSSVLMPRAIKVAYNLTA